MLLIYKIKRILKQLWKKLVMNLQIPRKTEAPPLHKQYQIRQSLYAVFLPGFFKKIISPLTIKHLPFVTFLLITHSASKSK